MHAATFQKGEASWIVAHEALSRLAKKRAMADAEEGRWLLAARRAAVQVHLAMGSFGEYVERLFGYSRRLTREKLRVAEALERLPAMMRALEAGDFGWCAVRELTRVAIAETEGEWLAAAQGKTVRQLEELVAGRSPGDKPDTPAKNSARRHVLRFEVTGETLALFRQATIELRRKAGSSLSDDDVLLEMARHVLGGPGDEGRSSYQIAVTVCAECGRASQDAGHETVPLATEVFEMACCDAQHLGRVDAVPVADVDDAPAAHVDDAPAAHVERGVRHDAPSANGRAAHMGPRVQPRGGGGAPPGLKRVKEAVALGTELRAHRASQSVPPAVRRAVLRRDRGRCQVPGCGNCAFLDVHHIALRSEGGLHDAGNLITMCGAHHRALHHGALAVELEGAAVRFRWADGSVYGGVANPTILETIAKVSSALRHMGFREGEVRRALAEVRECVELEALAEVRECVELEALAEGRERVQLEPASVQDWLRAALARLVPNGR